MTSTVDTPPRPSRFRRLVPLVVTALGLLAWSNLLVPALPADPVLRAVVNVAGVAGLLVAARCGGLSWHELGFGRDSWGAGARWGAAALVLVIAGYAAVLAAAPTVLANPQLAGSSAAALLLRGLVLIPMGTVLAEEVAFRGVLHAPAVRALSVRAAVAVTSVVFGLWHLVTALGPSASPVAVGWPSVAAVLAVTAVGGAAFGWLRHRTGSVLAPMGLHLGTNAVGLVAAAIALH